jgi:hypothetical protein
MSRLEIILEGFLVAIVLVAAGALYCVVNPPLPCRHHHACTLGATP